MTNFTFDPSVQDAVRNFHIQQAAQAGGPGTPGDTGTCWNWATSQDDYGLSGENVYSANIPYNKDGSIDFTALYLRLQQLIKYAINGDQADYNSMLNIAAMLMNIGHVWSQLNPQQQQSISTLLSPSVFSTKMQGDMLQALIYGTFYANNGNQAATQSAVQALLAQMSQAFGGIPVFSYMLSQAQFLGNTDNLNSWMYDHTIQSGPNKGQADKSFAGFVFLQTMQWEADFSYTNSSDTSNAVLNEMNSDLMNTILHGVTNPWEILALLFCNVFCASGLPDYMTQIAGNANLTNAVSAVGKQAQALLAMFNNNAGKFTTFAQAQAFFQGVNNLNTLANGDLRISGTIGSATSQLCNDICGDPTTGAGSIQVSYTFVVPPNEGPLSGTTQTVNVPIGELYDGAANQTPISVSNSAGTFTVTPTQAGFLSSFNALAANASVPGTSIVPAGYTQIETDMGQTQTSVTAKSSAVGQVVSNLMSIVQKFEALITAIGNSITQPIKTMTTASGSAGN